MRITPKTLEYALRLMAGVLDLGACTYHKTIKCARCTKLDWFNMAWTTEIEPYVVNLIAIWSEKADVYLPTIPINSLFFVAAANLMKQKGLRVLYLLPSKEMRDYVRSMASLFVYRGYKDSRLTIDCSLRYTSPLKYQCYDIVFM